MKIWSIAIDAFYLRFFPWKFAFLSALACIMFSNKEMLFRHQRHWLPFKKSVAALGWRVCFTGDFAEWSKGGESNMKSDYLHKARKSFKRLIRTASPSSASSAHLSWRPVFRSNHVCFVTFVVAYAPIKVAAQGWMSTWMSALNNNCFTGARSGKWKIGGGGGERSGTVPGAYNRD